MRDIFILLITLIGLNSCTSNKVAKSNTSDIFIPKNVKIYEQIDRNKLGPCEPSIAIDPTNPKNMVAGSVIDFVHTSNDGGLTWKTKRLKSELGVWGDPVLIADNQGDFYYFHLSDPDKTNWKSKRILDRIVCQKTTDKGTTWTDGASIGLNTPKQQDKPLATINPITGELYTTWTEFDKYKSTLPIHKSRILFSKSIDKGVTWSTPIQLNDKEGDCLDDDLTTEGAMPVSDGKHIFTTWCYNSKIYFTKSNDNGETWEKPKTIFDQNAGWSIEIPGIKRANGFPVLTIDNITKNKPVLYLNWADQNESGITKIFISTSTDLGNNWSTPLQIESSEINAHQFFNWMSVDNSTGNAYIIYYETNPLNDNLIDVKLATSIKGSKHFKTQVISDAPFNPKGANFFGDYNFIDSKNGIIRPIWTRVDNGFLSIWTALIELKK